jgi:hypothetical protein
LPRRCSHPGSIDLEENARGRIDEPAQCYIVSMFGQDLEDLVREGDLVAFATTRRCRDRFESLQRLVVDMTSKHCRKRLVVEFLPLDQPARGARTLNPGSESLRNERFVESGFEIVQTDAPMVKLGRGCEWRENSRRPPRLGAVRWGH